MVTEPMVISVASPQSTGHERPKCYADGHNPHTVSRIRIARQRKTHDGVKQGKTKAGQESELGIGQTELRDKFRADDSK
jgi:hypothetical protein